MQQNGVEARVSQNDLQTALGSRILPFYGPYVLT